VAQVHTAPVATVQATPIAPPTAVAQAAALAPPATVAPKPVALNAPLTAQEAAAPVLLPARVVVGATPTVITPSAPAQTQVATSMAPAPPVAPAALTTVSATTPPPAATPAATLAPSTPAPGAVVPGSMTIVEPADDGTIKVRIAAVPTRSAALTLWQNLAGMVPDLLTGRTPLVRMAKDHGHMGWRLGTGGFQDVAAAEQFCRRLRERGPNCTLGL
jgi:hypothetical protein